MKKNVFKVFILKNLTQYTKLTKTFGIKIYSMSHLPLPRVPYLFKDKKLKSLPFQETGNQKT